MKLTSIVGLIGIGYLAAECQRNRPYKMKYRTNMNLPSYSEYFREVLINKLDILFYGRPKHKSPRESYYSDRFSHRSPDNKNDSYQMDFISFETEGEATKVLGRMKDAIEEYGDVRVSDYYRFSKEKIPSYVDSQYGWTDLSDVVVDSYWNEEKWYIELGDPEFLG